MNDSPTKRAPYEVWECILLNAIAVSTPVLEVTCTPSTYLAFKRTCGDGTHTVYQHEYRASEKIRNKLRLVCRSWNEFANRWDTRERWIRFSSLPNQVSDERWRGAQRLELVYSGMIFSGLGLGSPTLWEIDGTLVSTLANWKIKGLPSGSGKSLRRLEMLHVSAVAFDVVFPALCEAACALKELRSLGLALPLSGAGTGNEWPLRKLSKCFPELVHLTLRGSSDSKSISDMPLDTAEEGMPGESQYDALHLKNLEVLLLFPSKGRLRLSTWSLPALKHFHIRPVVASWKSSVFPFLERHADTIETLDLDDPSIDTIRGKVMCPPSANYDASTIDFWGIFPRLTFLRCSLARRPFATYPREPHALECFANIDSIRQAEELIKALSPWVEEQGVKRLGILVLFGPYLMHGAYKRDKGVVRGLLQQCHLNKIRLVNPAGRPWVYPLGTWA